MSESWRSSCATSVDLNLTALIKAIRARFPAAKVGTTLECRMNYQGTRVSEHSYGTAVDIFPPGKQVGDEIFKWCKDNVTSYGVSYVIWYCQEWGPRMGLRPYCTKQGRHNHKDHLHIEVE